MRSLCAILAMVALMAAPALAGESNGTKKDSKIRIKNAAAVEAAVGVDIDLDKVIAAADPLEEFKAQGGKVLNPGQSADFKVKAGNHEVVAMFEAALLLEDPTLIETVKVDVHKGKTIKVIVTDDDDDDKPELEVD